MTVHSNKLCFDFVTSTFTLLPPPLFILHVSFLPCKTSSIPQNSHQYQNITSYNPNREQFLELPDVKRHKRASSSPQSSLNAALSNLLFQQIQQAFLREQLDGLQREGEMLFTYASFFHPF